MNIFYINLTSSDLPWVAAMWHSEPVCCCCARSTFIAHLNNGTDNISFVPAVISVPIIFYRPTNQKKTHLRIIEIIPLLKQHKPGNALAQRCCVSSLSKNVHKQSKQRQRCLNKSPWSLLVCRFAFNSFGVERRFVSIASSSTLGIIRYLLG